MDKIDHKYTDNIVCPKCGSIDKESWEWNGEVWDLECEECGCKFRAYRNVEVTYSTEVDDSITDEDLDGVI